ncbi:glycosyltransferase family 2 protein [Pedobacter sp. UBA5917]|jgi:glycosyltransferase involved in cell wall biosynthesis|uniref:glycosyltransferase family 2 protein n=1 Tax=Pedobacter sp. UBA5917 TaxID=1947061 RepID=UPI0025EFF79C|nr:glycosyltransferase family 2 protein [Pedobacter sp. UBA5917]
MNLNFSFIILTFNEEVHLPRLLDSIKQLNAPIFILDSGSTDNTLAIAAAYNAQIQHHSFENHPKQWDFALKNFKIDTPWIIGLDADQMVTPELFAKLSGFKNEEYAGISGIYFNRKNIFQGKWIRYGGYYPMYQLKMFRKGIGFSDLNENMDHRFIVSGNTQTWKEGHIIEENLKENDLSFWYAKHQKYSELVAKEEFERLLGLRTSALHPNLFGNPDERKAWFKKLWWQLPLYIRPYLYFTYRMLFQLGIFEGKNGIRFHYMQGLWFRLQVDKKLNILKKRNKVPYERNQSKRS